MELTEAVHKWVEHQLGEGAVIQKAEQLKGSTSSTLHQISYRSGGVEQQVVVRQFDNKEWLEEEPDLAEHEAESLRMGEKAGVPSPEVIAYEEDDRACGVPVVLMTKLDGRVELSPQNQSRWLKELARALAAIHRVEALEFERAYFSYSNLKDPVLPAWSRVPDVWEQVIQYVKATDPVEEACLIHRDFHPANVLWENGRVSGVVDWVNACRGPVGVDVGHCRVNLALLYGVDQADAFLEAYREERGAAFSYTPYWDIAAVLDFLCGERPQVYPGWAAFGMTGLTDRMMEERLDAYVCSLLKRLEEE
ncbi:phosphotransferase family protein [Lentibacillus sediminis]|uniref:phosphotransferase family protein n=1 Tax=Lentibacillus sediminis TaxID=1940529 RepID=UPI000C1B8762|nr:aminoglycoside phosphotransferase family protein [Lentibacillus sediminis]